MTFDITEEWIPVSPVRLYDGRGWTDLNGRDGSRALCGREVACGCAWSESLASILAEGLDSVRAPRRVACAGRRSLPHLSKRRHFQAGQFGTLEDAEKLRSSLRRTMWGQVGVIRSGESLIRACAQLSRWAQLITQPFETRAALEVKNMVQVAQCVAEAALWRENSVGAHYRSDFPEAKRVGWQQHSRLASGEVTTGRTSQKRGAVVARGPYRLTGAFQ